MTDIGKAYVQIIPSADGISGSVQKILDPEVSAAGQSAGKGLGASLGSAIIGALSAVGIEQVIEKTLKAGGDLQQSFGGLETIYGDAADQAKQFAMEASKAGISANDYAEQAVSFGASLRQAFGGDTEKAVQAANTAIMDMTDNAAKMGTPIENIQSAYQGFAKQNYTMLDNLKLGYGGTKTEMERLLKDAQKISGVKYDISNLGDVYDAIHVIQGELGLTGVAAEEAKTTLSGSFNAAKAALETFLATLSTGGDITGSLTTLITTMGDFFIGNLTPMLFNIVKAIPPVLQSLFSTLAPQIGDIFQKTIDNLPEILQTGVDMINDVVTGILQGLPGFITAVMNVAQTFVKTIFDNLPAILQAGVNILLNLVNGIIANFPAIANAAFTAIANFAATILQNLPTILQKGVEIIGQLVAGLISAIPKVVAAIPQIIRSIVSAFGSYNWLSIGTDIIRGIANGIKGAAGLIIDAAKNAARSAFEAAKNFLQIGSPSKLFADKIGEMIPAGIAQGITENAGVIHSAMEGLTAMTAADFAGDVNIGGRASGTGGYTQIINISSPRELSPSEVARQTRNATQQMALQLSGV